MANNVGQEKQELTSHILLREIELDAGSPTPWLMSTCIKYLMSLLLSALAIVLIVRIFVSFDGVLPFAEPIFFIGVLCMIPHFVTDVHIIRYTDFWVEDGVLNGVDLYTVERVRYGKHCVYLDNVRLDNVRQPKVLIKSIEDYYFDLTGVELP